MDNEKGKPTLYAIAGNNDNHLYFADNFAALMANIEDIMATVLDAICKACVSDGYVPAIEAAGLMPTAEGEVEAAVEEIVDAAEEVVEEVA